MFPEGRKYFRSQFWDLVIVLLLISPTQDPSRNESLKLVQEELIYIKDFLDKQNEAQWKHGNTINIVRDIDTLVKKLSHCSNVLDELTNSIREDIKQGIRNRMWYLTSGFVSVAVCTSLLFTEYPVAIFASCFSSVVFAGYCYGAYQSTRETLRSSRVLKNNTWEMRREVAKYRTNLEIMKMRIDSDRSSLFDENS